MSIYKRLRSFERELDGKIQEAIPHYVKLKRKHNVAHVYRALFSLSLLAAMALSA